MWCGGGSFLLYFGIYTQYLLVRYLRVYTSGHTSDQRSISDRHAQRAKPHPAHHLTWRGLHQLRVWASGICYTSMYRIARYTCTALVSHSYLNGVLCRVCTRNTLGTHTQGAAPDTVEQPPAHHSSSDPSPNPRSSMQNLAHHVSSIACFSAAWISSSTYSSTPTNWSSSGTRPFVIGFVISAWVR